VAHRGASAYAPEHSSHAYRLAIDMRADFVEQDLAVTRDGVLVCVHDLTVERTTNAARLFTARKPWIVNDFTVSEIKQLDAGSWFDRKFIDARILTFQEAIDLLRPSAGVGLCPELKDPEFYRGRGVDVAEMFMRVLRENSLPDANTPVIAQSFDAVVLKQIAVAVPGLARVYLLKADSADLVGSPGQIASIATWATGLGPAKSIVESRPELVKWAHAAGLTVTPWTFRTADTTYATVKDEMAKFLSAYDVDALVTDNPDMFPRW
jgi:glycerophosphoryl diester phosphodiesterase